MSLPINIIIGTEKGKIRISHRNPKGEWVSVSFKIKKAAKGIVDYIKSKKGYNWGIILSSSSMHFPEEEGITRKQIAKFDKELEQEARKGAILDEKV